MNVILRDGPAGGQVRVIPEPPVGAWPTLTVERPLWPPPGGGVVGVQKGLYRALLRRRKGSEGPPQGWLTTHEGHVVLSWQGWR